MGNKYSGLQIGIHWLVFCWLLWRTAPWSFADFPAQLSSLIQHGARILWYHYFNADGGASAGQAEISGTADLPKPKPMMTGMAHLGHLVIYLLFIVLPIIGLVMMYNRGNPWIAFGIVMPHAAEATLI